MNPLVADSIRWRFYFVSFHHLEHVNAAGLLASNDCAAVWGDYHWARSFAGEASETCAAGEIPDGDSGIRGRHQALGAG